MLIEILNPGATFLVICALLIGLGLGWVSRGKRAYQRQVEAIVSRGLSRDSRSYQSSSRHNDLRGGR